MEHVSGSSSRAAALVALLLGAGLAPAAAQPSVVAAGEGQLGLTPGASDKVGPPGFTPVSPEGGLLEGDAAIAAIRTFGGPLPDPPELQVVEDRIYGPYLAVLRDAVASPFTRVDKVAPGVEPWLNDDDLFVQSLALDGTLDGTMKARVAVYDFDGNAKLIEVELDNIPTFVPPPPLPPDELFAKTDIAVDEQNRITLVFTELPTSAPPKVRALRIDGDTGDLLDLIDINDDATGPVVAAIGVKGERIVIPTVPANSGAPDFGIIQGNFLEFDLSGPVVQPEFPISTTPAPFRNFRPAVAADPVTGQFTVTWDFVTAVSGDPADVRARTFDAQGVPFGDDFLVNVKPLLGDDGSQGQSDVAYGPGAIKVIVWAADGDTGDPDTDIYARAFLRDGTPITGGNLLTLGQFQVNTGDPPGGPAADRQDWPAVRFLPEPDADGNPQFAVLWRDVADATGGGANGTGFTFRCFSVDGLEDALPIFSDGFESGDTSSWTASNP